MSLVYLNFITIWLKRESLEIVLFQIQTHRYNTKKYDRENPKFKVTNTIQKNMRVILIPRLNRSGMKCR